jgi:hypothetical protein
MNFIIDMVHHNPGEKPFDTSFTNPVKLVQYGYNGQVFKHINCVVKFSKLSEEIFPKGSEELNWLTEFSKGIKSEIENAKKNGLMVFYHIDLFVLPRRLVELYKEEICNAGTMHIDIEKEMTLEIHRIMLEEIFGTFPEIDGLIIRVGETYLEDTPYHIGNGAVPYRGQFVNPLTEKDKFVRLINFLREEVCIKHGKYLIHRTWDGGPDHFHGNPDYYLSVTNKIEPHEKLLFSIKHTMLDFWRRVPFNESITLGKHSQIIEVQCQREYEGKGAYPSYVMNGVINGSSEMNEGKGLKDVINHPHVKGIYTWSRGGGWYGPYLQNEFWCDLNAYVISRYANNPEKSEEDIFNEYCREKMNLAEADIKKFRQICLLSDTALLRGRYCEAYDKSLQGREHPSCNWMRDDRLGGYMQMDKMFEYLYTNSLFEDALAEKQESVVLWSKARNLFDEINIPDKDLKEYIGVSIEFALRLFNIVLCGWEITIEGFIQRKTGTCNLDKIKKSIEKYDKLWQQYRELKEYNACCATLYQGEYISERPGMDASVNECRKLLKLI